MKASRDAFGHEGHASGANPAALAVGLHFDLAVDDVGHLVGFGMKMQGRRLVLHHGVLEQEEGAAGVLGEQLPEVEPAAREQLLVSFAGVAHDRDQLLHPNTTPSSFVGHMSHDECTVPFASCQRRTS